jgi:hypothetical protein
MRAPRWLDGLFLAALMFYALLGVGGTTFHGDESMQLYMSSDYFTAFVERAPERLLALPPYYIDSDPHLRILNGTVNRYAIGFAWHVAGYTPAELPPRPGWDWGLTYADNVATAHRPAEALLNLARLPSALFFAASIVVVFLLAQSIGGRGAAYAAALLYTLHPALLLNGRRALQEGSMLFFGLASLLVVARIHTVSLSRQILNHRVTEGKGSSHQASAKNQQPTAKSSAALYALLALLCGFTVLSKHSGILFVAGALLWLNAPLLVGFGRWLLARSGVRVTAPRLQALARPFAVSIIASLLVVVVTLALFIALSPALWNDPAARLSDLLTVRSELLIIQTNAFGGPMRLLHRIEQVALQPFILPLAHFESGAFDVPPMADEIARYMASPLSGIHWGVVGGVVMTGLALLGMVYNPQAIIAPQRHKGKGDREQLSADSQQPTANSQYPTTTQSSVLSPQSYFLITLLPILASLLVNPLAWQRYYLPLMALMVIFAGMGVASVSKLLRKAYSARRKIGGQ